ncbi:hypothetical protein SRHO_G00265330 [Serrasalmus rhombeus]
MLLGIKELTESAVSNLASAQRDRFFSKVPAFRLSFATDKRRLIDVSANDCSKWMGYTNSTLQPWLNPISCLHLHLRVEDSVSHMTSAIFIPPSSPSSSSLYSSSEHMGQGSRGERGQGGL